MGYKIDRIATDIQRELADILRSVKDPRVSDLLLSIVHVDVTNDLSYAKIYVGAMEWFEAAKSAVVGLKNAQGYIRRELGSRMSLRKVPELRFIADNSIEHSADIARMIDSLNEGEDND